MRVLRKESALARIRDIITSKKFQAGQYFSENDLAKELGVSRSPIRDALAVLTQEGLIEQIPQVGIRLREFSSTELRELFLVRKMIEPVAAREASRRAGTNSEVVRVLRACVDRMMDSAERDDVSQFLKNDTEFHWQSAATIGLNVTADIIRQMGNRIRIIGWISSPDERSMKVVIKEHSAILHAIEKGDVQLAGREALRHLEETKRRIEKGQGKRIFTNS